jgi:hypothetical protein
MLTRHPHDVDLLAGRLAELGAMARALPPSYLGGGDTFPAIGVGGERLGVMLPGLGLQLALDPEAIGITKPIPNVFSRSAFERARDHGLAVLRRLVNDERGAITTYDGILSSRAGGKADDLAILKLSFTAVSGAWFTMYRASGQPAAGSYTNISTGATKNNTEPGALSLGLTNPTGGDTKYLLSMSTNSSTTWNQALLVDHLWSGGNVNANSNTLQTVSSAALTRYTTGTGVVLNAEVTTALGATPSNLTVSYTDQAGNTGHTSTSTGLTPSAIVQRLQPSLQMPIFPLASGDYGIRAVASVTLSAAMGAGVIALRLSKILFTMIGSAANIPIMQDVPTQLDGIIPIATEGGGALGCLELWVFAGGSTTGDFGLFVKTCAG